MSSPELTSGNNNQGELAVIEGGDLINPDQYDFLKAQREAEDAAFAASLPTAERPALPVGTTVGNQLERSEPGHVAKQANKGPNDLSHLSGVRNSKRDAYTGENLPIVRNNSNQAAYEGGVGKPKAVESNEGKAVVPVNPNLPGHYRMVKNSKGELVRLDSAGNAISTPVVTEGRPIDGSGESAWDAAQRRADDLNRMRRDQRAIEGKKDEPHATGGSEQLAIEAAPTPASGRRELTGKQPETVPTDPTKAIEAAPTPEPIASIGDRYPDIEKTRKDATERWTRLSALHSGKLAKNRGAEGTHDEVQEAFGEYVTAQKAYESVFVQDLKDRSVDDAEITKQLVKLRLDTAAAASSRRTEFRKEFAQEKVTAMESTFLGKKFGQAVDKWAKMGGGATFLKRMWGNAKKGSPIALVGIAVGTAASLLAAPVVGGGVAAASTAAVTVALVRGFARSMAGAKLESLANQRDVTVADKQHDVVTTKLTEAADYTPGDELPTAESLGNVINDTAEADRRRNRNRYIKGGAVALASTVAGYYGGAAAVKYGGKAIEWGKGLFDGKPVEQFGTKLTPSAEKPVFPSPEDAPKAPEAWSTTLKSGDGFERVFERYAETKGIDPNGAEVHRWFLDAKASGLINNENVGKNISGGAPMTGIGNRENGFGGGYGYPGEKGDVTTLSPAMVSALNKEMAFDAAEDYIKDHGLNGKVTDAQLHALIDQHEADINKVMSTPNMTPAQVQEGLDKLLTDSFDGYIDSQEAAQRAATASTNRADRVSV